MADITRTQEMVNELASKIGIFSSWTQVGGTLIQIAALLSQISPRQGLTERREFVYGALVALNFTYNWDMKTQPEETEITILWMFTQLAIR